MTTSLIEPMAESKRWRSRDVKYWAGTWASVSGMVPRFEIRDFRAAPDSPANPYLKCVMRLPMSVVEQPMPVGIVGNNYGLAQHHQVAEHCFEGLRLIGIDPAPLRCEVGLTTLGEWMHLRIDFPNAHIFEPRVGDRLKLRLECFNSVDGSSRLVLLLGWLRLVCTNGMVIRETKTEVTDIHDEHLDLNQIPGIVADGMAAVQTDKGRLQRWGETAVREDALTQWVDEEVSETWNKKAASRVYHICMTGHDVDWDDPFAPGKPSEKPVRRLDRVPGSPETAANLYDVSQAMAWVASGRNNPEERLDWQSDVLRLITRLSRALRAA